jgi:hypothetical protein
MKIISNTSWEKNQSEHLRRYRDLHEQHEDIKDENARLRKHIRGLAVKIQKIKLELATMGLRVDLKPEVPAQPARWVVRK